MDGSPRPYLKEPYQHLIPGVPSAASYQRRITKQEKIAKRYVRAANKMVRLKTFTLDDGIDYLYGAHLQSRKLNGKHIEKTTGTKATRLEMFRRGGTVCVKCGIKGSVFHIERHKNDQIMPFSINLYGIDKNGHEIMMTWDHILPVSLGGSDKIENAQCMCRRCNEKKGNTLSLKEMLAIVTSDKIVAMAKIYYSHPPIMDLIRGAVNEFNALKVKRKNDP